MPAMLFANPDAIRGWFLQHSASTPDAYFQLACSGASGGTHWL